MIRPCKFLAATVCMVIIFRAAFANPPLPIPNLIENKLVSAYRSQPTTLPKPEDTGTKPQMLTLRDAILLALRKNPTIQSAELNRVVQKFAVVVAHNEFEPQYTFTSDATFKPGSLETINVDPSVKQKTALGTKFTATMNNDISAGYESSVTLSVTQPLLKGLGPEVTLASLHDAEDTEKQNILSFKDSLMSTITTIIQSYYQLVQDYQNYNVQKQQLDVARKQLQDNQLQVKVGKMAPAQLTTQISSLYSQQLSLTTQANTIQQDYQTLLTNLGLNPNAKLSIDQSIHYENIKIPDVKKSIATALANDPTYQSDLLAVKINERGVVTAKDAIKPTLDLTASETQTLGAGGSFRDNSSAITEENNPGNRSVKLSLTVPIDDVSLKSSLITAETTLETSKITLASDKRTLITSIINDIRNLKSQQQQIKLAEQTVKYSEQTYNNDKLELTYGKIGSFQLTTDQQTLISDQQNLISQKVSFITQYASFLQDMGTSLEYWNIKVRY